MKFTEVENRGTGVCFFISFWHDSFFFFFFCLPRPYFTQQATYLRALEEASWWFLNAHRAVCHSHFCGYSASLVTLTRGPISLKDLRWTVSVIIV